MIFINHSNGLIVICIFFPDGTYKALILDFCLSSSCYATMALREILKMDTSSTTHAKLGIYHAAKSTNTDQTEGKEDIKIEETDENTNAEKNIVKTEDNNESGKSLKREGDKIEEIEVEAKKVKSE